MSLFISNRKEKEKFTLGNTPKGWWLQASVTGYIYLGTKLTNGNIVRISKDTGEVYITEGHIKSDIPVTPVEIEIHTYE